MSADLSSPDTSTYPARTLSDALSMAGKEGEVGLSLTVDATGAAAEEKAAV